MNDNGNFVLYGADGSPKWQSFTTPTDTILPSQELSSGTILHARLMDTDYSNGRFILGLETDGNLTLYTVAVPSGFKYDAYWSTNTSGNGSKMVYDVNGTIYYALQNSMQHTIIVIMPAEMDSTDQFYHWAKLDPDGVLRQYKYPRKGAVSSGLPEIWRGLSLAACSCFGGITPDPRRPPGEITPDLRTSGNFPRLAAPPTREFRLLLLRGRCLPLRRHLHLLGCYLRPRRHPPSAPSRRRRYLGGGRVRTRHIRRDEEARASSRSEGASDSLLEAIASPKFATSTSLLRLLFLGLTDMATESESGNCNAWAARDPSGILSPYKFNRRTVRSGDVSLKITHCGVCYADVIWTHNQHNDSKYPLVPGHEIAGVVTEVGSDVKAFKEGDHVGVGTYVNSCRDCENCNSFLENHCPKNVYTFNGIDTDGTVTKGGYSTHIVVHERYCFKIPDGYPLAKAAPLLCAGITVYTPMMRHNMNQPGKSLGVIGLGGLGHMAVKFGKAFGLKVTVFSTSESKREEAINLLGADNFVISSNTQQMESLKNSLHFIVDTAAGDHPFDPYLSLLKVGGVMAIVCFPSEIKVHPANLNLGARTLAGSVTGGTKDIQEMVNFCSANKIYPEVEIIKIDYINEALQRLVDRDVKYRFVIDIENSFK